MQTAAEIAIADALVSDATDTIADLWAAGLDTHRIADAIGKPESFVYNWLSAARSRGGQVTKSTIVALVLVAGYVTFGAGVALVVAQPHTLSFAP